MMNGRLPLQMVYDLIFCVSPGLPIYGLREQDICSTSPSNLKMWVEKKPNPPSPFPPRRGIPGKV